MELTRAQLIRLSLVLALGSAVSLGLARFSYAVLLPTMRQDLGWNYFTAGLMNTLNAGGYLIGALSAPRLIAGSSARTTLLAGGFAAAILLALHGWVRSDVLLGGLRLGTGIASAWLFVAGGLLAARLASRAAHSKTLNPSLVLGIFYGGVGLGIVFSSLFIPFLGQALSWSNAWVLLALASLAASLCMSWRVPVQTDDPVAAQTQHGTERVFRWQDFKWALAAYCLFGVGYIGYMTFIISLLREQNYSSQSLLFFYLFLGCGVMASPWIWARLLQKYRGGQALATLSALLALATLLPIVSSSVILVFASGLLFGSVFLSLVASTTALVRHNLPASSWSAGIAAFTIIFAFGQIVGPVWVGKLSDGAGGLATGFLVSAVALGLGAVLACFQKPLFEPV